MSSFWTLRLVLLLLTTAMAGSTLGSLTFRLLLNVEISSQNQHRNLSQMPTATEASVSLIPVML